MSLYLVLQTELGEEDRLRKFLEALGVKGTVSSPCAVRLKDIDKEKFENEWRHKAISMKIDASWVDPNLKLSNFHLFATDMDSTLLQLETLDEIATLAGKGEEVSRITDLSMKGHIHNFSESLRMRVAMLKGVDFEIVERVLRNPILPSPGAPDLIAELTWRKIPTVLISGGFSCVTNVIKERYGFTYVLSNELGVDEHGKLTGECWGPRGTAIIDGIGKLAYVSTYANEYGCNMSQVITMGDGSNDIPMLSGAGMSVAWHAKPKVRPHAKYALDFAPLSGILPLFSDYHKEL